MDEAVYSDDGGNAVSVYGLLSAAAHASAVYQASGRLRDPGGLGGRRVYADGGGLSPDGRGLVDRYGRRAFTFGALSSLFFRCISTTGSAAFCFCLRCGSCTARAGLSTTSIGTVITDLIPASRRGEGMGWYGMAMTVAMAIGPMLGTYIVGGYSFQTLFLVATGLSLIAFILAYMTRAPYQAKPSAGRIQLVEKSVLPVTVAIFSWPLPMGNYDLSPAVCRVYPGQSGNLFPGVRRRSYLDSALCREAVGPFRRSGRHYSVPCHNGRCPDRLKPIERIAGLITAAILYGIGFGSAQPALQAATLRIAPENRRGAANASFMTAFDLGIGLGAILLGLVSERIGYAYLFTVTAVSVVVSLVIFAVFVRRLLTSDVTDKE